MEEEEERKKRESAVRIVSRLRRRRRRHSLTVFEREREREWAHFKKRATRELSSLKCCAVRCETAKKAALLLDALIHSFIHSLFLPEREWKRV